MTQDTWEENPGWEGLPQLDVGDIVQLKLSNSFQYLVKTIVTAVDEDKITTTVEAIFDWHNKDYQINGGDRIGLVGKELSFKRLLIQKVIKKPGHM